MRKSDGEKFAMLYCPKIHNALGAPIIFLPTTGGTKYSIIVFTLKRVDMSTTYMYIVHIDCTIFYTCYDRI